MGIRESGGVVKGTVVFGLNEQAGSRRDLYADRHMTNNAGLKFSDALPAGWAVVTGAASGLGLAISKELGRDCNLMLIDSDVLRACPRPTRTLEGAPTVYTRSRAMSAMQELGLRRERVSTA